MKKISEYLKWYVYITTSILVVYSIIILGIYKQETIPAGDLWRILLSGLLTTVVTVLFIKAELPKVIYFVLHYFVLSTVMLVCGLLFGWIEWNIYGVLLMLGSVGVVYILSFITYYIIDLRCAADINKKLKEKYKS